ncbi:hypothetical protein E2C01_058782 [Portunus trituberculatus]|uniref:Uncharacterized protein n=1 Tax=Portunus trituberculatus TaxID=210409 RepID=A0A5B7H3N7_PORTR|nr:hypothetical protein [Portunus trituberculatus]
MAVLHLKIKDKIMCRHYETHAAVLAGAVLEEESTCTLHLLGCYARFTPAKLICRAGASFGVLPPQLVPLRQVVPPLLSATRTSGAM